METLFFILGIASVVVIATAIVAVVSIVKVTKLQTRIKDNELTLSREIENVYKEIYEQTRNTNQRIDGLERQIFSQMDSRFDKLENKLVNKK